MPDDILLSLDGMEIENKAGFIAAVSGKAPGAEIKLRLLRGGKEKRLAVTLGAQPVEQARGGAEGRADPAARHRRAYGDDPEPRLHAGRQLHRLGQRG